MKNIFILIVGLLIVQIANSQQQSGIGLLSSLSSSEINTINSKMYKFSKLIVSNNYQGYSANKHHRISKHISSSIIGDTNQTSKRIKKDTLNSYTLKTITKDSINKSNSNNCCVIKYFLTEKGAYKYGVHVEGNVQDCIEKNAIPHAYVSLNSAVVPGKYLIIPTTSEGNFNIDVVDDSIGSITVIKKGYADKNVKLQEATIINENTSYAFNVCLDKETLDSSKLIKSENSQSNLVALFGFNKHSLNKATRNLLDSLIKNIKQSNIRPSSIELNGYTDSKGNRKYNLALSRERAIECRRYLITHGLAHTKIRVHAFGSSNPLEKELLDNNVDNPKARAQNRRVEIVINHK